ncbi:hypothetical protein WJX72_011463 [[Myrmecia] bisecta]|uniref:NAD(P)-binding protein n=1 Tax=[Myrmecia] bisecta TaxID=41462 RepID=A0AAW1QGG1_9CHLO
MGSVLTRLPGNDGPWHHVDLSGLLILITGSDSGIGYHAAKDFALRNAHVIIATRTEQNGTRAVEAIMQAVTARGKKGVAEFMHLDLASLESVHAFADAFHARNLPLHRLINNAGMFLPEDTMTEDGMEVQLQVNYFAHVYLSHLLLPKLAAGAPSRIIWVSSPAEASAPPNVDWDNLVPAESSAPPNVDWDNLEGKGYHSDLTTYGRSKVYELMTANEMQKWVQDMAIDVYAVEPGVARTGIFSTNKMDMRKLEAVSMVFVELLVGQPDFLGAISEMFAASAPESQLPDKGGTTVYGPP